MAEHFSFFDPVEIEPGIFDREYNAEQFTRFFKGLIETGLMKNEGDELKVTNTGGNMVSTIGTGVAYVEAQQYMNDSPLNHIHDTESIGVSRIDRIVVRLDLNTNARWVKSFVKKGTPSASPVAPALTRNAQVYEISLAQVRVVGGQTFIANNAITDERGIASLCPWATSKILPNYDDDTLQDVLTQVQQSNAQLSNHLNNHVIHTYSGTATGANAKTINLSPAPASLLISTAVVFLNQTANTGPVTINVNGRGVKKVLNGKGKELKAGNLVANGVYTLRYNGTAFMLQGEGGGIESGKIVAIEEFISGDTGSVVAVGVQPGGEFIWILGNDVHLYKYRLDTFQLVIKIPIGSYSQNLDLLTFNRDYVYVGRRTRPAGTINYFVHKVDLSTHVMSRVGNVSSPIDLFHADDEFLYYSRSGVIYKADPVSGATVAQVSFGAHSYFLDGEFIYGLGRIVGTDPTDYIVKISLSTLTITASNPVVWTHVGAYRSNGLVADSTYIYTLDNTSKIRKINKSTLVEVAISGESMGGLFVIGDDVITINSAAERFSIISSNLFILSSTVDLAFLANSRYVTMSADGDDIYINGNAVKKLMIT